MRTKSSSWCLHMIEALEKEIYESSSSIKNTEIVEVHVWRHSASLFDWQFSDRIETSYLHSCGERHILRLWLESRVQIELLRTPTFHDSGEPYPLKRAARSVVKLAKNSEPDQLK